MKLVFVQIKDYRRADKKSAGPQSHILEGVTWEEAKKMQDAAVTQTGMLIFEKKTDLTLTVN